MRETSIAPGGQILIRRSAARRRLTKALMGRDRRNAATVAGIVSLTVVSTPFAIGHEVIERKYRQTRWRRRTPAAVTEDRLKRVELMSDRPTAAIHSGRRAGWSNRLDFRHPSSNFRPLLRLNVQEAEMRGAVSARQKGESEPSVRN